jgi:hypothetical protein
VSAQDDEERSGMGVFLDWIHKLSGPPFIGGGISGFYGRTGEGLRFRLTCSVKISFNETSAGATSNAIQINMITIQPTLEYGLPDIDFDIGTGAAFDLYTGQFDTVRKWSFPLFAQWRPRGDDKWVPRLATGVRFFPAFAPDDFSRLGPLNVERSGWEAVWQAFGGVDYINR